MRSTTTSSNLHTETRGVQPQQGTVRLDSSLQNKQDPFLFAQPCFTIPLHLSSWRLKTLILLDFGAFACLLDEEFTRLHMNHIVKKLNLVHVEIIDGQPLSSRDVTHKIATLEVKFGNHYSSIVFKIIRSPSASIILKISWLERYNLQIDWKSQNIEFPVIPFLTERTNKPLTKKPPFIRPLFIRARAFTKAAKTSILFIIYATLTSRETTTSTNVPTQYKEFQDVFEKNNVDILPKHRP